MTFDTPANITEANRRAWNAQRFDAWISAYGSPEAEAAKITNDPKRVVHRLSPYIGEVAGKQICHVQGSHGRIAVALSQLGAEVSVIDFSEENRRFALDLAAAANVTINYELRDIMDTGNLNRVGNFDIIVLELGILHYHQDIDKFFAVMQKLAFKGATLFLNEFHPVHRKLYWNEGPHDYFDANLTEADVPNPNLTGKSLGKCLYRFWTMGEILTAVVKAGFTITRLDEHPDWKDSSIPGSFTLLAYA